MNILYIHGFGSHFNKQSEKVLGLSEIGTVFGVDIDYTKTFPEIKRSILQAVTDNDIDLLVGTSMGGFCSSVVGESLGIPFVAINPVLSPEQSLSKYIGEGVTFSGEPYTLNKETLSSYPSFALNGCGFILLDRGDELIDAEQTQRALETHYRTKIFAGGNHRFTHIKESLAEIKSFSDNASFIYGFGAEDD